MTRVEEHRKLLFRILERVKETKNVRAACLELGLSRSTFYFLRERYREKLPPEISSEFRRRASPSARMIPAATIDAVIALTRRFPSYSARRVALILTERGVPVSASSVRKFWSKERITTRAARLSWAGRELR